MKITVKLFAYFRDNRFKIEQQQWPEGTSVGAVVDAHHIDREEVGVLMRNFRHAEFEDLLVEDDILAIFPVVGGG
jgi:molybdopterin synthase sulfur carrier subunit